MYFLRYKTVSMFLCSATLSLSPLIVNASQNIQKNSHLETPFKKNLKVVNVNSENFDEVVDDLWNEYLFYLEEFPQFKEEHKKKGINFSDKTMKFSMDRIGVPDERGYPLYIALHGGGEAASWVNDWQWSDMKVYYKGSVNNGIYVAPRGVTDTWNLHSVPESYPLYDRLIENMVLFENVDPNRVYFLGFSAGGDGVYQVVPRMPDRFAAANMSAGHHNWIKFDNLYNTPFLIQVGELDSMYKRNTVSAENYLTLKSLNKKYDGGYVTDVFIHQNQSHNGWQDNSERRDLGTVIADPAQWLKSPSDSATKKLNTNAIDWLDQFTRNPVPEKLVWDLSTRAPRTVSTGQAFLDYLNNTDITLASQKDLFYWLDISVADEASDEGLLIVELHKKENTVFVQEATGVQKFRVLLNEKMLDLSKPIVVKVGNQTVTSSLKLESSTDVMTRTLLERSDKNFAFSAEFVLTQQDDGKWVVDLS